MGGRERGGYLNSVARFDIPPLLSARWTNMDWMDGHGRVTLDLSTYRVTVVTNKINVSHGLYDNIKNNNNDDTGH